MVDWLTSDGRGGMVPDRDWVGEVASGIFLTEHRRPSERPPGQELEPGQFAVIQPESGDDFRVDHVPTRGPDEGQPINSTVTEFVAGLAVDSQIPKGATELPKGAVVPDPDVIEAVARDIVGLTWRFG